SDSDAVLTALAQNFPRELHFWERGWKQEFYSIAAGFFPTCIRVRDTYFDWPCGYQLFNICLSLFSVRSFVQDTFQIHKDATDLLVSNSNNHPILCRPLCTGNGVLPIP
nr:hypothetical protein [Tanacetum cinerariifolium]